MLLSQVDGKLELPFAVLVMRVNIEVCSFYTDQIREAKVLVFGVYATFKMHGETLEVNFDFLF